MKYHLLGPYFLFTIESVRAIPTWAKSPSSAALDSPCPTIQGVGAPYVGACKTIRDCLSQGADYSFLKGGECGNHGLECCYESISCTKPHEGNLCLNPDTTPCVGGGYVAACPYGTSQDLRCCVTGLSSLQSNFDQATGLDPGLHNNYVEAAYITEPRYPTSDISPDLNPFLASTNPPEPNPYLPLTNPLNSNPFSPQQAAGDNSNLYPADNSNSNPFAAWNK